VLDLKHCSKLWGVDGARPFKSPKRDGDAFGASSLVQDDSEARKGANTCEIQIAS
jgi:hypothetical protein